MRRALLILLLAGCKALPVLEAGVCGNGVLEAGEDCDSLAGPSQRCSASCRFECSGDAVCPASWACDSEQICRHAEGFDVARPILRLGDAHVAAGDFDGDGRLDLLASQAPLTDRAVLAVAYGDGVGGFADVFERTQGIEVTGYPLATELDGDGRLDVVVPVQQGLVTLFASQERTLEAFLYPRSTVPTGGKSLRVVPWRGFPGGPYHQLAYLLGDCLALGAPPDGDCAPPAVRLPAPVDQLRGEPLVAELDPGSQRDQLLLALGDRVLVYAARDLTDEGEACPCLPSDFLCQFNCHLEPELTHEIVLPAAIGGGVLAGDMDGDGDLDLLVGVPDPAPGAPERVYRAVNDGHGGFAAPVVDASLLELSEDQQGLPLAVGQLDADPRADVVTRVSVLLRRDAGWLGVAFPTQFLAWTLAAIGDLDGDGQGDVVTADGESPGFDFWASTGHSPSSWTRMATSDVVHGFAVGDFDGDRRTDLAVADGEASADFETLSVWYGAQAVPGPPVVMGLTPREAARLPYLRGNGLFDLRTDLLATHVDPGDAGQVVVSELEGQVTRTMFAPFELRSVLLAGAYALVELDGGLFAVTDFNPWMVFGLGRGTSGVETEELVSASNNTGRCANVARGRAEVAYTLFHNWNCNETSEMVETRLQWATAGALSEWLDLELPIHGAADMKVEDLDGDGFDELILAFTRRGRPGVAIYPGLAERFDFAHPAVRAVPDLRAITTANLDADPARELVIAVNDGLRPLEWSPGAGIGEPGPLFGPGGAGHLLSADVNGDGLDDLIVAGERLIFELLARPSL